MIRSMRLVMAAAAAAALAAGTASVAASSLKGTEAIKARHEAMESIKAAMGSLAAIAKKQAPFEAEVVEEKAGAIADELKKAAALFPEGSEQGEVETWAKPEIWSDFADFEKKMKEAGTHAEALESVTEEEAFAPALGELGNSCKSCHDAYRRPKH